MRLGLFIVLPFVVALSTASWNKTQFISTPVLQPNSTTTPLQTIQACPADCVVQFDNLLSYRWQSYISVNTTIIAATVEKVIYPKYNATKIRTYTNELPSGYEAPNRNEAGTVVTTMTLNGGDGENITTVLAYPTVPIDYAYSYWWSGVRPTATAGSVSCITQTAPKTVRLPSRPENAKSTSSSSSSSSSSSEGEDAPNNTNYYLVSKLSPDPLPSLFPHDPVLTKCRNSLVSVKAIADSEPKSTASFITITSTRTETQCRPDMVCAVRTETTETGSLLGPSASRPNGSAATPPAAKGSGQRPGDNRMPNRPAQPYNFDGSGGVLGAAGAAQAAGMIGAFTVHTEKPAAALQVPTKTLAAAVAPPVNSAGPAPELQPVPQSMVTKAPTLATPTLPLNGGIGMVTLSSTTLSVAALPPPEAIVGPHVEQPASSLLQVGSKTMTFGVQGTINNQPVTIQTTSGGAYVAIIGSGEGNGRMEIQTLSGSGGIGGDHVDSGGAGSVFAPKSAALPASSESSRALVTIGDTVLTPNSNGGFLVSGTPLILGGAPITIYDPNDNGGNGSPSGVGSRSKGSNGGTKPTLTVLALTTDASGSEVVVVNGKTSTLPSSSIETGRGGRQPQYIGSDGSATTSTTGGGKRSSASSEVFGSAKKWRRYTLAVTVMAMTSW